MKTERYVNAPLDREVYDALKVRAKRNGRFLGRELADIARRALAKNTKREAK